MKKFITLLLLLSDVVTVQAQSAMVLKMKDGTRNVVLGKAPATDAANVDGQGCVDGSDINMLINILLGKN